MRSVPFTDTLPIRRLNLAIGDAAEVVTAYVGASSLQVSSDPQRHADGCGNGGLAFTLLVAVILPRALRAHIHLPTKPALEGTQAED
ncbi:putative glycolipid-binding domain-containing protein [Nonomuraea sp. 3N208]|uniref:putative glycolipid-binding domain-containing protein n=1 Tax=Nonomuraea sp. 3N208 TaxID=3457421 RepID=UPI003FCD6D25